MKNTDQDIDIKCPATNENVRITKQFSFECGSACCISTDIEDVVCTNMTTCDDYKKGNAKCLVLKELE